MSRKRQYIIFILALAIALPVLHFSMGLFKRHNFFTAYYDKGRGDINQKPEKLKLETISGFEGLSHRK